MPSAPPRSAASNYQPDTHYGWGCSAPRSDTPSINTNILLLNHYGGILITERTSLFWFLAWQAAVAMLPGRRSHALLMLPVVAADISCCGRLFLTLPSCFVSFNKSEHHVWLVES